MGKRGPPRNPNPILWRTTVVRDTPEQMALLEATGHTQSEAYRLGSRIFTKTKTPAGLALEEIQARLEAEALIQAESQERTQALLSAMREQEEGHAIEQEEIENLERLIEIISDRIYINRKVIRADTEPAHKRLVLNGIKELSPKINIEKIENFIKTGFPDSKNIKKFVTGLMLT